MKSRERREAGRVCPGGAGCRNRHFVAGHFALEIQLAAEPPHRGMEEQDGFDDALHAVPQPILAGDVRELVG